MNEANPFRITATAGTKLVRIGGEVMSLSCFSLELYDISPVHSNYFAGSTFRPLSKIPHCWSKSIADGAYFNSIVTMIFDHVLRIIGLVGPYPTNYLIRGWVIDRWHCRNGPNRMIDDRRGNHLK